MRAITSVEHRILRSALMATNADRAAGFPGERGDLADKLAADGLLEFDSMGHLGSIKYFVITEAGRQVYASLEEPG